MSASNIQLPASDFQTSNSEVTTSQQLPQRKMPTRRQLNCPKWNRRNAESTTAPPDLASTETVTYVFKRSAQNLPNVKFVIHKSLLLHEFPKIRHIFERAELQGDSSNTIVLNAGNKLMTIALLQQSCYKKNMQHFARDNDDASIVSARTVAAAAFRTRASLVAARNLVSSNETVEGSTNNTQTSNNKRPSINTFNKDTVITYTSDNNTSSNKRRRILPEV